jgi:hypothetical protein
MKEASEYLKQCLSIMKGCDLNTRRKLQLCSAVDRIQLATDSCMKKKASVHAHIHKISMITGIPLTQV